MLLFLIATAQAQTYESEPQHYVLQDYAELYSSSEYDTGWLPSGSPLQVRFQIASLGGAYVGMEGDGHMSWPEALTVQMVGEPGTGEILVDAELAAITSLKFDVAGYQWEQELDHRGVVIEGGALFDPFLLTGSNPDRATVEFEGNTTQLISYSFGVFTGVDLEFDVDMGPEAVTTFEGVRWWTEEGAVAEELGTSQVAPSGEASQPVETTFVGRWQSQLDLVLNPVFSVCVDIVGCYDLVDTEIPIPLAFDDFEQEFEPTVMHFPLPVLALSMDEYSFGEVQVGQVANLELPIVNAGDLELEGFTGLLGSPFFTSYPDYFLAGPGQEDGVVVSFSPEAEGPFSATLVLESNDPMVPIKEITLTGTGVSGDGADPDGSDEADDGGGTSEARPVVIESEVGCGCGTTGAPAWPGLLAFAAGGLVVLRRRRDEE